MTIAAYTHPPLDQHEQQSDTAPGPYYVSCRYYERHSLLSGPYATHQEALDRVNIVRRIAEQHDPRAVWYAFGTCRHHDQSFNLPGYLQKHGGYDLDLNKPEETCPPTDTPKPTSKRGRRRASTRTASAATQSSSGLTS